MSKLRQKLDDVRVVALQEDTTIVDNAAAYFDRRRDHELIRAEIKRLYGIGIKSVSDPHNKNAKPIETYSKEAFNATVDAGMLETIVVGFGAKVSDALSNLFTEDGQRFTLVHDNADLDLQPADQLINGNRSKGGFLTALSDTDRRSIEVGSAAIFTQFFGGKLKYQTLIPSDVRFFYSDLVIEDGQTRAPDVTTIEDCYAVRIRLRGSDIEDNTYLAIFGRSAEWTQGRHVQYKGQDAASEIPAPGDKSIIAEYEHEGAPANPLSVYANANQDMDVPEYPLAIIRGVVKSTNTPMPFSSSLYDDSRLFDIAASHTLGASQDAARGTNLLEVDETGATKPLPRTLTGNVVTQPGQKYKHESHNAGDPDTAYDTLKKEMVDCGHGWGVPDYMVASDDYTLDASSGIALEVKTRPLVKVRKDRIRRNSAQLALQFDIERFLLATHTVDGDDNGLSLLLQCRQDWQPGKIVLPENKKDKVSRISDAMKDGLIDFIGGLKEYHDLSTDQEAFDLYEKMKARSVDYPALTPQASKTKRTGLFGTTNNG